MAKIRPRAVLLVALASLVVVLASSGCSSKSKGVTASPKPDAGSDAQIEAGSDAADGGPECSKPQDCTPVANASVTCSAGSCKIDACTSGRADCDQSYDNGCEATIDFDPQNCGGCGFTCASTNGKSGCVDAKCVVTSCEPSYDDCNDDGKDGCETFIGDAAHCGSCIKTCAAGELCDTTATPFACVTDCGANTLCGSSCIDTQTDPNNCGGCGKACAGGNANYDCAQGKCVFVACQPGFADCDSSPDSCETNVLSSAQHCGACNSPCSETCVAGVCDPVTEVGLGAVHTCVVRQSGKVQCWGTNTVYALGDGTQVDRAMPITVPGVTASIAVAGAASSCALTTAGKIVCWGRNGYGELGNGTKANSAAAVPVNSDDPDFDANNNTFTQLGAGQSHACALDTSGRVWCWGRNESGQIGDGTIGGDRAKAVKVTGLTSVTSLGVGVTHNCAVHATGVSCWGAGASGALGNNDTQDSATPVTVQGLASPTLVRVGGLVSCALDGGGVRCWGSNAYGAIGDGGTAHALQAKPVTGVSGVVDLSVGASVVVKTATGFLGWGNNHAGQVVGAPLGIVKTPQSLSGLPTGTNRVVHNAFQSCGLHGGRLSCWGHDAFGELGVRDVLVRKSSAAVSAVGASPLSSVSRIVAGGAHTCVIAGSQLSCAGRTANYQTSFNDVVGANPLRQLPQFTTPRDVVATDLGGCAIDGSDGNRAVWCWGTFPPVGGGPTPLKLTLSGEPTALFAGANHACALVGTTAECWGSNDNGQLGRGTTGGNLAPAAVTGLPAVKALALGRYNTCAIDAAGDLWCWGYNAIGSVGNATTGAAIATPVKLALSDVKAVALGDRAACAVVGSGGDVYCWGLNWAGQLGDGTQGNASAPKSVGLSGATAVVVGAAHACAAVGSGVKCWGDNTFAQLGVGNTSPTASIGQKVDVLGVGPTVELSSNSDALPLGNYTCARLADGSARCWGSNSAGKCAGGEPHFVSTPQPVQGL